MPDRERGRAVVAGIGETDYSSSSGRTEAVLAIQAVEAAIADSGIPAAMIDGLVTYAQDSTHEIVIARNLGLAGLRYCGRVQYGGGDCCATLLQAKLAVEAGVADVVVCYRGFNERSGSRYGLGVGVGFSPGSPGLSAESDHYGLYVPFGLRNAAGWIAMFTQRYMWRYGATSRDLANVSVSARRHAASNPRARFYQRPITLDDHQSSRWIVEPLRLLDCCMESDGGVAVVVTRREVAEDWGAHYVSLLAAAQASGPDQHLMTSYYRHDILAFEELRSVAGQLWQATGLSPASIDVAVFYDHFTPMVFAQIEAYGFCGAGEAKDFTADGNIDIGGGLPINPHGGQLGEAYMHGMNGMNEAVRQLRGTAVNQVAGARAALVSAPPGAVASGLILTGAEA